MSRTKPDIHKSIKKYIKPGAKLLIGVSGGVDSMVLLDAVCSLRDKLKLHIEVAHIDHGIRRSSAADARFVKARCREYGNLAFHLRSLKPPADTKINLEGWGREVRYEFFNKVRKKQKLDWILTAHNANDQIETFFIKLLSNKEILPIVQFDAERKIIRPLIDIPRNVIEEYSRNNQIGHREDETNADPKFLRNRIRIKLLPFLSYEFGDRVLESVSDRISKIYEDTTTLSNLAELSSAIEILGGLEFGSRQWLKELRLKLNQVDDPLKWRLVQGCLYPQIKYNLGREKSCEIARFFESNSPEILLPGKVKLRRKGGRIELER